MARTLDLPNELWYKVFEQRFAALPFRENPPRSGSAAETALVCAGVSRRWKVCIFIVKTTKIQLMLFPST
jgi:hypothetical protein